jgi:hypothetical protein
LAILTKKSVEFFAGINTQNPVTWSDALKINKMKLAYLPTDVRPIGAYIDELVRYDDLFLIGFYTDAEKILGPQSPKAAPSHAVLLHGSEIIDPQLNSKVDARTYERRHCHTKRIFRVVPKTCERGL